MIKSLPEPSAFQREIAGRFGLVPNFFSSAPDAPEVIERLWIFAKAAYLDNPIPALFKERLFVYLSRFCEVRYCIVRHCGFLVGYGHSSGDLTAPAQSVEQAIRLLRVLPPWQRNSDAVLDALETSPVMADWPAPETEHEDHLISAATLLFVEPRRSDRARRALRHALGGQRFEHLLGLLAFIRTAHYWTVTHPDLLLEEDVQALLSTNEELARVLLQDPEAARCDMGVRLFSELEDLRALNERRELEKTKRELEVQLEQKDILLKEVNHRVKNSLQIVSSILQMQVPHTQSTEAADAMRSASARVLAIAAVHERLYTGSDVRLVALNAFLGDLCKDIGRASGCPEGIEVNVGDIDVPTDMAIPLALIVNELVTNVIRHVGPPCHVAIRTDSRGALTISVSDTGQGPSEDARRTGMGSRIVQVLTKQLGAKVATKRGADGYSVEMTVPVSVKQ